MIILDLIGLVVLIGAFVYFDRRPEVVEPDMMTTRPMTLREWIEADTDEFITEPVDEPTSRTNKKAIDISYFGQSDINSSSNANTATNKNTKQENLFYD